MQSSTSGRQWSGMVMAREETAVDEATEDDSLPLDSVGEFIGVGGLDGVTDNCDVGDIMKDTDD